MASRSHGKRRTWFRARWILAAILVIPTTGGAVYGLYKYQNRRNTLRILARAERAHSASDWEQATTFYRQYLRRKPADVNALSAYADALLQRVKDSPELLGDAIRTLQRLVRVKPRDTAALENLINLYMPLREFALAEDLARRWVEADPNSVDAVLALARAHQGQNKNEAAVDVLQTAIARMPHKPALYPPLIALLAQQPDQTEETSKWLTAALRVGPDSHEIHAAAFSFYQRRGNLALAERHLRRALEIAPHAVDVLIPAALFHLTRNELDEAEELLKRAREAQPENRALLPARAALAIKKKDPKYLKETADDLSQHARDNEPGLIAAAAELYLVAGQLDRAGECIQRLSSFPQYNEQLEIWLDTLQGARTLFGGRPYEALPFLEDALQRNADNVRVIELLARAYARIGALDEAARAYGRAVILSPDSTHTRLALARIELQQGHFKTAAQHAAAVSGGTAEQKNEAEVIRLTASLLQARQDGRPPEELDRLMEHLQRLARSEATDSATVVLVSRSLRAAGQASLARRLLESRTTDPNTDSELQAELGRALLAEESYDAAERKAQELIERFPDAVSGYELRLKVLASSGRLSEAAEHIDHCPLAADAKGRLWEVLAQEYLAARQVEPFLQALRRAAELAPASIIIRRKLIQATPQLDEALEIADELRAIEGQAGRHWKYERARALLRLDGSPAAAGEAAHLLRQCLAVRPEWMSARLLLARALEIAGPLEEAADAYRIALAQNPQQPNQDVAIRLTQVLNKLGRFAEADRILNRLAAQFPEAEDVLRLQARRFARRGELDSATATAEQLLALRDNDPAWAGITADLHLRNGNAARAEQIARSALSRTPDSPALLWTLAKALIAQGRTDEAESAARRTATDRNDAAHYVVLAQVLLQSGKGPESEQAIRKAAELEPENPAFWAACTDYWGRRGNRAEQLAAARKTIKLRGENATESLALAELLAAGDSPEERAEAAAIVRRLLEANPDDARALLLHARLAASAVPPDLAEAENTLTRALSINPRLLDAYRLLAAVQTRHGRLANAVETVETALAFAPDDDQLLMAFARLHSRLGNHSNAASALRQLLKLRPHTPEALELLVYAYKRMGQIDQGIRFLEHHTPQADRTPAELILLAKLYELKKDYTRADELFQRALEMDETSSEFFQELIQFYGRRAQYDRIYELASRHREELPDDVESLALAGELLATQASSSQLAEAGTQWLKTIAESDPDHAGDATYRLARCHYKRGNLAKAEEMFRRAARLAPMSPAPVNALAWLYSEDLGRPREALSVIEQYLSTGGVEDAHLLDTHGTVLLRLGQYDTAERKFTACLAAVQQTPTEIAARYHLGLALLQSGRTDEALPHIEEALQLDKRRGGLTTKERNEARQIVADASAKEAAPTSR